MQFAGHISQGVKFVKEVEGVLEEDEVGILAVLLRVAPGYCHQPLE